MARPATGGHNYILSLNPKITNSVWGSFAYAAAFASSMFCAVIGLREGLVARPGIQRESVEDHGRIFPRKIVLKESQNRVSGNKNENAPDSIESWGVRRTAPPESAHEPAESINWLNLFVSRTAVGLRFSESRKA
jgi:hypothetical protein